MTNQLVNEQAAPLARVGSRDIRLDALRGLLLILMVINHSSTVVDGLTFQQLGYLSEAEGFVFLSGFVAGLTYSRMSVQQPAYCLWRRALLRARTIYLFHLVAFLACFLFLRGFAVGDAYWESWNPALQANFLPAILSGVVLLFQPRYMDILPMYCLFILATPAVVLLLKEKKWRRILGASLITWMLAQFGLRTQLLSLLPEGLPVGNWSLSAACS
jgi:hypothetical protein